MHSLWLSLVTCLTLMADFPQERDLTLPAGFTLPQRESSWLVAELPLPEPLPSPFSEPFASDSQFEYWTWKVLPDGLLYRSYAAGVHEPRFSTVFLHDSRRGWYWDNTLGGRVGVFRYGTAGSKGASGFQLDMEGAVFARLTPKEKDDLEGADFRFGVPMTWSDGTTSVKFGYNHISSHLGDEFLLKNPDYPRINYARDGLIWGISHDITPEVRVYGETGWAFATGGGAKPWEFQFGSEYTQPHCDERRLVPFAAINAHLREEFNFDGSLNIVAGWQWLGRDSGRAYRLGLQYYRGKSSQFSFLQQRDRMLGGGMWFEY